MVLLSRIRPPLPSASPEPRGGHGQRLVATGAHGAVDALEGFFRQREDHVDRVDLADHHQAVGVGRVHDIAGVDQAGADAAGDRRGDGGEGELHAGVVDLGLVVLDRGGELVDRGALGVQRLLGGGVFLDQALVARCRCRRALASCASSRAFVPGPAAAVPGRCAGRSARAAGRPSRPQPSVKPTRSSWPSTRERTVTVATGCTVPTPVRRIGTSSSRTSAVVTLTAGTAAAGWGRACGPASRRRTRSGRAGSARRG